MSDVHRHYCRQCRTPWEHDSDRLLPGPAFKEAHRCPACGTVGWVRYYGTESHDEMCQMEALLELSEDERVPGHLRRQAKDDFAVMARRLHRPNTAPRSGVRDRSSLEQIEKLLEMLKEMQDTCRTGRISRPEGA